VDTKAIDLAAALARHQDGVVLRAQAEALGVTPAGWRARLRQEWLPLLSGTAYLPHCSPGLPESPGPRALGRAAVLATGGEGALCLGSALRVWGVEGSPVGDPEHLVLAETATRHQRVGVALHWWRLPVADRRDCGGLAVVSPTRACYEALRCWEREAAVSVLDSALHRGVIGPTAMDGLPAVRLPPDRLRWLDLLDGRSESPLETRLRLLLHDLGLPGFEPQVRLVLSGFGPVRVDFLGAGVVLETDGRGAHDGPTAAYKDRRRHEALERAGFVVVRLTWADVVHAPDETVRRIIAALGRASRVRSA